jgi:hypothetical protein
LAFLFCSVEAPASSGLSPCSDEAPASAALSRQAPACKNKDAEPAETNPKTHPVNAITTAARAVAFVNCSAQIHGVSFPSSVEAPASSGLSRQAACHFVIFSTCQRLLTWMIDSFTRIWFIHQPEINSTILQFLTNLFINM